MKRSAPLNRGSGGLSRSTPLSRGSGLAKRSAKMAKAYAGSAGVEGRRALVARLLAERPRCQAALPAVCTGDSVDVHELLARSAGGSILDVDNLVCVCRRCHTWIGDHPKEALVLGLRLSRYPGRQPGDHRIVLDTDNTDPLDSSEWETP